MKPMRQSLKSHLIILVIAVIASLAVVRTNSMNNVPYCIQSPGCTFNTQPKGKLTEKRYGFPATYRETVVFRPNNSDQRQPDYAGYASASTEREGFSLPYVLVNIVFWSALLKLIASHVPIRPAKQPSTAKEAGEAKA